MTEVLERRRKAHMEFVIRHRGVEFVFPGGPADVLSPDDVASSATPASPGDVSTPAPGDKTSPLLGSSFRKKLGTSSTSVPAPPVIASAIISEFGFLDDAALRQLMQQCRESAPDATDEEIAELGAMSARRIRKLRNIDNPVGLLISQTANCFVGEPFQMYRRENAEREERLKELYIHPNGAGKET